MSNQKINSKCFTSVMSQILEIKWHTSEFRLVQTIEEIHGSQEVRWELLIVVDVLRFKSQNDGHSTLIHQSPSQAMLFLELEARN